MRQAFLMLGIFGAIWGWAPSGRPEVWAAATQQHSHFYYVQRGNTLEVTAGDPAGARFTDWQVWLYSQPVRFLRSGAGLADTRWGVLRAPSEREVMEQLVEYQQFERAYRSFFGSGAWGQLTFTHPLAPIAVSPAAKGDDADELLAKISGLDDRLRPVVAELRPSLTNNDGANASAAEPYFLQVRNSIQDVARFYDRFSRLTHEGHYLSQELALLTPGADQAASVVPKVQALLPSVKLPASKDWMTSAEDQGRDGTVNVTVTEVGSSAWVQQSWTGGEGSMAGAKFITIVPYQEIGRLRVEAPGMGEGMRWTLCVEPAIPGGFPQKVTSPERHTATRTLKAVDLKTTEESLYLTFSSAADAQAAYTFFLYHKERGA